MRNNNLQELDRQANEVLDEIHEVRWSLLLTDIVVSNTKPRRSLKNPH
jgi:hypothetical protein